MTKDRSALGVGIAATFGNGLCITAAVSSTFGTLLVPISLDFGWPRAAVSGVLGIIALVSALSYPFIGRAMDRFGARRFLIGGSLSLGLLVMSLSLARPNPVLFYLQFGLVGLAGATCASAMFCKIVSNWFDARRGLMLGVTAGVGNGVGATVMPIIAGLLLPSLGWRGTYVAIGGIVIVVGFPILFFLLREAPPAPAPAAGMSVEPEGKTLAEAIRTREFWILLAAVAVGAGGMTAVFTHVVPMLMDRGVSLGQATGVVAMFALVTAAWQVVTGALLDRMRSPRLVTPMFVAAIAGLLLLQFGTGSVNLALAGVLLGIGMGAEYGALSYFTSRYFGLRHYGAIIGALYSAVILAQGATPALMDLSFGRTGSYDQAAVMIAAALAFGMTLLFFLPTVPRTAVAAEPMRGQGTLVAA
jgi:MFS family permease